VRRMHAILAQKLRQYEQRLEEEVDPIERDSLRHRMDRLAQEETEDEEEVGDGEPVEDLLPPEEPEEEMAAPAPAPAGEDSGIDDQLRGIEDSLEEISDVLRSHEEILHEIKMDEASPAEIDEEVRERKDELTDDDTVTGEEYGLSQTFYGARKATRSYPMGNLREARMRRLAEKEKKAQSHDVPEGPDTTLRDHWRSEEQRDDLKSDAGSVENFNPASEIEKRTKEERGKTPPMWKDTFNPKGAAKSSLSVQLVGETGKRAWHVVRTDTNQKIARIDRPEGVDPSEYAKREYGMRILKAIHKKGFADAMDSLQATPVDVAPEAEAAKAPEAPATAPTPAPAEEKVAATRCADHDMEDCPKCPKAPKEAVYASKAEITAVAKRAAADHMERFKRTFQIAILAANRNLTANPLKVAFHDVLEKVGINNPIAVIERAFRLAGEKYGESLMEQANEWMGMEDQSLAEWERTVRRANTLMPPEPEEEEIAARSVEARSMRLRAAAGSAVPSTDGDGMDERGSDLAARFAAIVPKPAGLENRRKLAAMFNARR